MPCLIASACAFASPDSTALDGPVISGGWHPARHPDAAFREIEDEGGLVVLSHKAEVKVLNPVGIRVFELIDGTRTPEEVARAVFDEFEVAYETALSDVYEFLGELDKHGMLAHPMPEHVRKAAGLQPRPVAVEAQEPSN